jgi:hypothetical protein
MGAGILKTALQHYSARRGAQPGEAYPAAWWTAVASFVRSAA